MRLQITATRSRKSNMINLSTSVDLGVVVTSQGHPSLSKGDRIDRFWFINFEHRFDLWLSTHSPQRTKRILLDISNFFLFLQCDLRYKNSHHFTLADILRSKHIAISADVSIYLAERNVTPSFVTRDISLKKCSVSLFPFARPFNYTVISTEVVSQ